MSGHSKWHNIQKTKGAADAKRSATFTKIAKEIQGRQHAQRQHQAHHRQGAGLRQHR